uniref:Replicative DNA helicase n=1 Tax=Inkyuleea mariana TaxID=123988 RepID=A0A4D6WZD4_9FLOR|nr:replication helicase subunit [Inkyuleea mariana]
MKYLYNYPLPPQNYLAEEILLGIILINPDIFPNIVPSIKAESFFLESHQLIYIHLIEIYKKNKLHPLELLYYLSNTKTLYKIGGINKIMEMMKQSQIFISSKNINIYTKELIELINNDYIKRLMIQYGYNIIRLAYVKQFSSYKLYNKASHYLNFTVKQIPKENFKNFQDLIGDLLLNIKYKEEKKDKKIQYSQLIKSGFIEIDKLTSGLPNGDLIVIAGRPSMGKTSFAINIANNILKHSYIGIYIFSLEMSSKQILNKFISISSNISTQDIILNNINIQQWHIIQKICNELLKTKIHINDNPNMSIDYIEYTSKLLKKEKGNIQLIIIDYLQLIQVDNYKNFNRTQELSYITRKLKLLSQYLYIPIIILSQLNRSIETRTNKKPILSDLKESGCINYKTCLDLAIYPNNYLNITKIFLIQDLINIKCVINKLTKRYSIYNLFINPYIKLLLQYIFNCQTYRLVEIFLTHNHKYLINNKWYRTNNLLDNMIISKYNIRYNLKNNYYLGNIFFIKYSKVYDIHMIEYLNFLCSNIILHNSIEQDADIVMMLYEKEHNEIRLNNEKILDIILCKNRNGPTGSCELLFSPNSTIFKNIQ